TLSWRPPGGREDPPHRPILPTRALEAPVRRRSRPPQPDRTAEETGLPAESRGRRHPTDVFPRKSPATRRSTSRACSALRRQGARRLYVGVRAAATAVAHT